MIEPRPPRLAASGAIRRTQIVISIAVLLLVSLIALPAYPGGILAFVLFDVSFVAMLILILPKPRPHTYIFFAGMLFLGFWAKLMLHLISGKNFIEPIGDFSGSAAEWELALGAASAAAIGVSMARIIQLKISRGNTKATAHSQVPAWYPRWRRSIWFASLLSMLALNLLNFQFAFYQTGVHPKLILPYHLNVPLGWLISIGFALWLAVLIQWEFANSPRNLASTLVMPVVEGLVSSTSALSRSFYFLHSVAYFFAIEAVWAKLRVAFPYQTLVKLFILWMLYFAISLALVQLLRIHVYHLAYQPMFISMPEGKSIFATPTLGATLPNDIRAPNPGATLPNEIPAPTPGATLSNQIRPMAVQLSTLFVDRWIGIEGVLAVSSYPQIGLPLLIEALREDPKKGSAAMYQTISKSDAVISKRFSFGTLPGIVGFLFYSGSVAMVFFGTILVTMLMMVTERVALHFTGNPFLVSLMALGMANVACQIAFPYLAAVYIAQLWTAIAFVWLLQRAAPSPCRT